jgi:hypothetical protein
MSPLRSDSKLTRRRVLQGSASLAVASLIPGCSSGSSSSSTPPAALAIATTSLTGAYVNIAYSAYLAASGGSGSGYTWSLSSGTLPAGLALNASTGVISGTPTAAGSSSLTFKVTDSSGATATASLTLAVTLKVFITTTSLPSAVINQAYAITLAASGGSGSGYTWSVTSGASTLSAINLSLASNGLISGVPAALGSAVITVKVTDSASNTATASFTVAVTNPQAVPSGTITSATVAISNSTVGKVGTNFVGLSFGKNIVVSTPYTTVSTNTNLVKLFKLLALNQSPATPPVFRTGGTQVDSTAWVAIGAGGTNGQVAKPDIDALASFMAATGWQCLYAINLGGAAYGLPGTSSSSFSQATSYVNGTWAITTTAQAAAEVAYLYNSFAAHGALPPWVEIGNECDQYAHTASPFTGLTAGYSLSYFETLWATYRTAILNTTPTAIITGPAAGNNESTWTAPFIQWAATAGSGGGKAISLATQHYYREASATSTTNPSNFQWENDTLALGDAVLISYPDLKLTNSTYLPAVATAAQTAGVPLRLTETNSFNSAGSDGINGVSNGYASALWVIDHMFACAAGGCVGVNISGDSNTTTGYQPISFSGGSVTSVNPEYYGMLLFALAGAGTLLNTTAYAGSLNVTAYTIQNASGGLSLVIDNKDLTNNIQVAISLPQNFNTATLLQMTQSTAGAAPSLSAATGVTIQGATVGLDGTFTPAPANTLTISNGTQTSCYVPALSAVLIQLS